MATEGMRTERSRSPEDIAAEVRARIKEGLTRNGMEAKAVEDMLVNAFDWLKENRPSKFEEILLDPDAAVKRWVEDAPKLHREGGVMQEERTEHKEEHAGMSVTYGGEMIRVEIPNEPRELSREDFEDLLSSEHGHETLALIVKRREDEVRRLYRGKKLTVAKIKELARDGGPLEGVTWDTTTAISRGLKKYFVETETGKADPAPSVRDSYYKQWLDYFDKSDAIIKKIQTYETPMEKSPSKHSEAEREDEQYDEGLLVELRARIENGLHDYGLNHTEIGDILKARFDLYRKEKPDEFKKFYERASVFQDSAVEQWVNNIARERGLKREGRLSSAGVSTGDAGGKIDGDDTGSTEDGDDAMANAYADEMQREGEAVAKKASDGEGKPITAEAYQDFLKNKDEAEAAYKQKGGEQQEYSEARKEWKEARDAYQNAKREYREALQKNENQNAFKKFMGWGGVPEGRLLTLKKEFDDRRATYAHGLWGALDKRNKVYDKAPNDEKRLSAFYKRYVLKEEQSLIDIKKETLSPKEQARLRKILTHPAMKYTLAGAAGATVALASGGGSLLLYPLRLVVGMLAGKGVAHITEALVHGHYDKKIGKQSEQLEKTKSETKEQFSLERLTELANLYGSDAAKIEELKKKRETRATWAGRGVAFAVGGATSLGVGYAAEGLFGGRVSTSDGSVSKEKLSVIEKSKLKTPTMDGGQLYDEAQKPVADPDEMFDDKPEVEKGADPFYTNEDYDRSGVTPDSTPRIGVVEQNGNLWNMMEGKGPDANPVGGHSEVVKGMPQGLRNWALDTLVDYMETDPEFTRSVGIVSGDPDEIVAGQEIRFDMLDNKLLELIGDSERYQNYLHESGMRAETPASVSGAEVNVAQSESATAAPLNIGDFPVEQSGERAGQFASREEVLAGAAAIGALGASRNSAERVRASTEIQGPAANENVSAEEQNGNVSEPPPPSGTTSESTANVAEARAAAVQRIIESVEGPQDEGIFSRLFSAGKPRSYERALKFMTLQRFHDFAQQPTLRQRLSLDEEQFSEWANWIEAHKNAVPPNMDERLSDYVARVAEEEVKNEPALKQAA